MSGTSSCCHVASFPYGCCGTVPLIFIFIAYIFFSVAAFNCKTFTYEDDDGYEFHFGYWGYHEEFLSEGCFSYKELADATGQDKSEILDASLRTGRAVGVLGVLVGAFLLMFLITATFVVVPAGALKASVIAAGNVMILASMGLYAGIASKSMGCFEEEEEDSYYYSSSESYSVCYPNIPGGLIFFSFIFFIVGTSIFCCCAPKLREGLGQDDEALPEGASSAVEATAVEMHPAWQAEDKADAKALPVYVTEASPVVDVESEDESLEDHVDKVDATIAVSDKIDDQGETKKKKKKKKHKSKKHKSKKKHAVDVTDPDMDYTYDDV